MSAPHGRRPRARAWIMAPLWIATAVCPADPARAWGDEGHEIIARVAAHYLTPAARRCAQTLLGRDDSGLTGRDLAHEATWADKYRDSDRGGPRARYEATRRWHYVDLELDSPDLVGACDGRPALPAGTAASRGPAEDCIVDKLEQFRAELADARTDPAERLVALQFVLHLVGDLHQPLHAADDHDAGGNDTRVRAPGIAAQSLHHDWDSVFVSRLGGDPDAIAQRLVARIGAAERGRWARGSAADWALESFAVAKAHAYGPLPPGRHRVLELPDGYVPDAMRVTAEQLSKAGVRLAWVLNRALPFRVRSRMLPAGAAAGDGIVGGSCER